MITGRRELTVWAVLWAVETPLILPVQPSWLMAALASAILLGASAALLHAGAPIGGRVRTLASRVCALSLAAVVCGGAAALAIRLLYAWLAPSVEPFGLAFKIATDTVWAAFHAALVGRLRGPAG